MAVLRIVPNFHSNDPDRIRSLYENLLGLNDLMDIGFIRTYGSEASTSPQISIISKGGSGTPVPDISVVVTDVDAIYQQAKSAKFEITYEGPLKYLYLYRLHTPTPLKRGFVVVFQRPVMTSRMNRGV